MKAGRELDALVAEKVMGWQWGKYGDTHMILPTAQTFSIEPGALNFVAKLPHYSTDIAAAWELVEKGLVECVLKLSDGRWFAKSADKLFNDNDEEVLSCGFDIDVSWYEIPVKGEATVADTAPLAICLAALKSVGIETDHPTE